MKLSLVKRKAAEEVEERVNKIGLELSKQPEIKESFNELPKDITLISSAELGKRHAYMVSQHCYALAQLGKTDVNITELEEKLRMIEAQLSGKLASAKERWRYHNKLYEDAKWLAFQKKLVRENSFKNLLGIVVDSFEKKANCLSREISRRTSEFETSRRSI